MGYPKFIVSNQKEDSISIQMAKCSAEVINEFNVGLFSTELSASKFISAYIDYVLETHQNKALEGSKGKYWTSTGFVVPN